MLSPESSQAHSLFDFGGLILTYDRWYETPFGILCDAAQRSDVLHFLARVPPGGSLLDVGCGTSHWTHIFASLGYAVVAVDLSVRVLRVAQRARPHGVAFLAAEACALPFASSAFDVVAAMATLEFVTDPSHAIREMARCVKAEGTILIGTLNGNAPLNRARVEEGREPYASAHLYSPDELRQLLQPCGAVRMVATNPERAVLEDMYGELAYHEDPTRMDGPFIVAEVRR